LQICTGDFRALMTVLSLPRVILFVRKLDS
jgi:hypothetical protein